VLTHALVVQGRLLVGLDDEGECEYSSTKYVLNCRDVVCGLPCLPPAVFSSRQQDIARELLSPSAAASLPRLAARLHLVFDMGEAAATTAFLRAVNTAPEAERGGACTAAFDGHILQE
jgi:hypothetical protein